MSRSNWRPCGAIVAAVLVGGCAGLPPSQGQSHVQALVVQRLPDAARAGSAPGGVAPTDPLDAWLAEPLTLERAQQIALRRSPALQASLARLGIGAADAFDAGRLQNPSLGLSWLLPLGGTDGSNVGASLFLSLADGLMRGSRRRIAATEFAALQEQVAAAMLDVVADTQRAWFDCVAAGQRVAVRRSIADAAALAADLAQQYRDAGNLGALEVQMQRAEASQARIELQEARMALADARATLQKVLGLPASQVLWTVPEFLPDMTPDRGPEASVLAARLLDQRLDIAAARRTVQARTEAVDATRRYRLLADSRVGAALDREGDGAKRLGPAVEFELPVFHQGQGAVARAQARLEEARAALRELEVAAQAELSRQLARRELAQAQVEAYREALIPEREAVVARLTEQANYMLVDGFRVLLARQQEYAAYAGYVDAQLAFWHAHVELLRAMGSLRGMEESP